MVHPMVGGSVSAEPGARIAARGVRLRQIVGVVSINAENRWQGGARFGMKLEGSAG